MIDIGGRSYAPSRIIEILDELVSELRQEKIDEVLEGRTKNLIPVIEGLHNSGNIAAVMRSAEGMGFCDFHLIENKEYFKTSSRTTQGADKWLELHRWKQTTECFNSLKSAGFQIVVTELGAPTPIEQVDFSQKTALVFGNEASGITDEAKSLADLRCMLPMSGFVESYNISVAAALCLQHAAYARRESLGSNGDLDPASKERLKALYFLRSVRAGEKIVQRMA